jgi:hypothetical protein
MGTLSLEPSHETSATLCGCCGESYRKVWGFLYDDDSAYAVYYATLSSHDRRRRVEMAIGIGNWGEHSKVEDRLSMALDVQAGFKMTIVDAADSPWVEAQTLLGKMLDRSEALAHPLKDEFFRIADYVVLNDPRIKEHLSPFQN